MELTAEFKEKMQNSLVRCAVAILYQKSYETIKLWLKNPKMKNEFSNFEKLPELMRITGIEKENIFEKQ